MGRGRWVESLIERKFIKYIGRYELEKECVEEAVGILHIRLTIAMPKGCEDMEEAFRELEHDPEFLLKVEELVRKRLDEKRGG